jgi:hydrogenase maturation protease
VSAIVIGVGNPYRRDDGVGPAVVQRLRPRGLTGVTLAECDGEPTRLLDLWAGADLAVVVDAVRTGSPRPGVIHRRSLLHPSVGASNASSSHVMELGDSVALAAALDRLPGTLLLFAVEAADTSLGVGLSPELEAAASILVEEITELLKERPEVAGRLGPPLGPEC